MHVRGHRSGRSRGQHPAPRSKPSTGKPRRSIQRSTAVAPNNIPLVGFAPATNVPATNGTTVAHPIAALTSPRRSHSRTPPSEVGSFSGSSTSRNRDTASHDAAQLGGQTSCHFVSGTSAKGSKMPASRAYSVRVHSRNPPFRVANSSSRATWCSCTSGGAPPPTPMPFIRLCRPSARGLNPQTFSSPELTARQLSQASHDHRDLPPAVPRRHTMHKAFTCETSHRSHFAGESSHGQDCQGVFQARTGPRIVPQGMCTDSSWIRSRSAASVALSSWPLTACSSDGTNHAESQGFSTRQVRRAWVALAGRRRSDSDEVANVNARLP